ncbi:MAG: hypothetical protein IIY88_03370 [Eubacterium sp.]|nr:hypothetical protein [Eubacterium sp.]
MRTKMMNRYLLHFAFRVFVFVGFLLMYIYNRKWMLAVLKHEIHAGITPLHLIWFVFMSIMITHIFPSNRLTMALRKSREQSYVPDTDYSDYELLKFVQDQNVKAWMVLLVWLIFNAIWGFFYLIHWITEAELFMLTVFYYLSDYICIMFFCPFQRFIMKNRCCVNCRIFDWGHFMMFTPMLFIKSFLSWSLFFTSVVVLIHWEILYARHPERFWYGSNKTIRCENCNDKICRYKKLLGTEPPQNASLLTHAAAANAPAAGSDEQASE